MSPILSLVLILAVMMFIVWRRWSLNYAVGAGILLTGMLFSHADKLIDDMITSATSVSAWEFLLIFYLVYLFTGILTESGMLKEMLASLEKTFRSTRLTILIVPTLIGLVPTPSGAIISAPFVKDVGDRISLPKERMHLINYWFRHVTEYLNPIYPGPILLVAITGISFGALFAINIPILLMVLLVGYLSFILPVKDRVIDIEKAKIKDAVNIASVILPLMVAVLLPIIFGASLVISLSLVALWMVYFTRDRVEDWPKIFRKSFKPDLQLLVFLVLAFKIVLENSGAVLSISEALLATGLPPIFLIILIPALVGFLTGMTLAPVSITIPILLPLMQNTSGLDLGLLILAFASLYNGIMVSPMHLCFSVTQKYFDADYGKIYRSLLPASGAVFLFALLIVLLGWPPF